MKSVFTKKNQFIDDFVILLSSSYPSEYNISFFPELCTRCDLFQSYATVFKG